MQCERCGRVTENGVTYTLVGTDAVATAAQAGVVRTVTTTYFNFRRVRLTYCVPCAEATRSFWLLVGRTWLALAAPSVLVLIAVVVHAVQYGANTSLGPVLGIALALALPLGFSLPFAIDLVTGLKRDPSRALKTACERKWSRAAGFKAPYFTEEAFVELQRANRPLEFPPDCCRCNTRIGTSRLGLNVTRHGTEVTAPICSACLGAIENDDDGRTRAIRRGCGQFALAALAAVVVNQLLLRVFGGPSVLIWTLGIAAMLALMVSGMLAIAARRWALMFARNATAVYRPGKGIRFGNRAYQGRFNVLNGVPEP